MKRLALVVGLGTLGGCDVLFQLEHVEPRVDAASVDALDAAVTADVPQVEACPAGYATVANAPVTSTYRFSSLQVDWNAAEMDCVNDSMTGITHLVVFEGVSEITALRPIITSPTPWGVHVGYSRNTIAHGGSPTAFTSVTGELLLLSAPVWAANEPDNGGGTGPEECGTFISNFVNVIDGPISEKHGYLCECDGNVADQVFQNTN